MNINCISFFKNFFKLKKIEKKIIHLFLKNDTFQEEGGICQLKNLQLKNLQLRKKSSSKLADIVSFLEAMPKVRHNEGLLVGALYFLPKFFSSIIKYELKRTIEIPKVSFKLTDSFRNNTPNRIEKTGIKYTIKVDFTIPI